MNEKTTEEVRKRVAKIEIYTNRELAPSYDNIAAGRIFAEVFRDTLRYNIHRKSWMVYDGKRWVADADTQAELCAEVLARSTLQDAAQTTLKDYQTFAFKLQDRGGMGGRKAMLADAIKHLAIMQTDLDADVRFLNVQNCVIDLAEMRTLPHSPDLLLSKIANVSYDPDADPRRWNEFVRSIMNGNVEKADFLQKATGYALTGKNEAETSFILYGPTTRNGKTTFSETVRWLFGEYGGTINPETLAIQRVNNGSAASPDIASLHGVRFLQMSEPPKQMLLDVAKYKGLTGKQEIKTRFLHENPFVFTPQFALFINGNHLPKVTDETVFDGDRIHVITFDRHFARSERNPYLKEQLRESESLSATLNWMLSGLIKFRNEGSRFNPPACVAAALAQYVKASNKMESFMDDCTERDNNNNIPAADLYPVFTEWCQKNGYGVEGKHGFMDALRRNALLTETATVNGKTVRNVVCGHRLIIRTGQQDTPTRTA